MKEGTKGSIIGIIVLVMVVTNIFGDSFSVLPTIISVVTFIFIFGGGAKFIKKMEDARKQQIKDSELTRDEVFEKQQTKTDEKYKSKNSDAKYEDIMSTNRPKYSKRCKKCNSLISSDDRYCPECGASQCDTIICEYCGHENPASNALCEKCNGFL